jgi:hypothetical protein
MSDPFLDRLVEVAVRRAMRAGDDSDRLRAATKAIVDEARGMVDRELLEAIYVMLRCR